MKTLTLILATVVTCTFASAEVTIFDNDFVSPWAEHWTNHKDASGGRGGGTCLTNDNSIEIRSSGAVAYGSDKYLSAYIKFDITTSHPDHRLHNIRVWTNAYDGATIIEYKPASEDIYIDGTQDTSGEIDFPNDSDWHHLVVDLTSETGGAPPTVGSISFVVYDWGGDKVNLFVDDVTLTSIPEPGMILVALGGIGIFLHIRG